MKVDEFENWKDFFEVKLEKSKLYEKIQLGKNGDTVDERFIPRNINDKTDILIGYLDEKLLYWKFENSLAKGFNEQQDLEFFYRYDFSPNKSYGEPGLRFTENNIDAINSILENGLNGVEIQYFREDKLIKSKIFQDKTFEHSTTINFEKRSFWRNLFNQQKEEFEEKRIELPDIFSGLKNKNVI